MVMQPPSEFITHSAVASDFHFTRIIAQQGTNVKQFLTIFSHFLHIIHILLPLGGIKMIMYFWVGMILFSVVSAAVQGGMGELTSAIMQSAGDAVSLCIRLTGTICLWSGLMNIAERSGLTSAVCRLISPLLRLVFPKMDPKGETAQAISMNLTANMLGLGNAATPLGLEAMKRLSAENGGRDNASPDMIKFIVMNSAAFHLIPTTVASMRQDHGCASPFDIMPAAWVTSALSLAAGLTAATIFIKVSEGISWKK